MKATESHVEEFARVGHRFLDALVTAPDAARQIAGGELYSSLLGLVCEREFGIELTKAGGYLGMRPWRVGFWVQVATAFFVAVASLAWRGRVVSVGETSAAA